MSKFDFSEGVARLSTAMTTGAGEVPFIARMHEAEDSKITRKQIHAERKEK
jgi:hypothetical protein